MASLTRLCLTCLFPLTALAPTALATPSADALAACSVLAELHPQQLAYNDLGLNLTTDYGYEQATQRYWSRANTDNVPACVFLPESASMVADAVKTLNTYTTVPWAVKGGGHNPNRGYSSTQGGILIAMSSMSNTYLDDQNYAHVGPGARWEQALADLEPAGRAIVGGRLGDVGVAGYTLGGGLSFLSAQYGLAADNIVNFEVVTAAGEITNANSTFNTDLFYALRGGGGQFAIVTSYIFQSYPIDNVWGGTKIYTRDKQDQLLAAVHNLTSNYYDPKAAVIVTADYTIKNLVDIFVVFLFYNSPDGPGPILDEFNAIPALVSNVSVQSYTSLLEGNNEFNIYGMRYLIRSNLIPNFASSDGLSLYEYQINQFMTSAGQYQALTLDNLVFSTAIQPVPAVLAAASSDTANRVGGMPSAIGLDPRHGDRVWMEYDVSWLLPTTDSLCAQFLTEITQPVINYSRTNFPGKTPTNYQGPALAGDQSGSGLVGEGVDVTNYNPLFMNDAMFNQQPVLSYGQGTYNTLLQTYQKWDPNGFFARTGGFKYT